VLMAHTCNPSYLGGWDWEDRGLRPTWANSLWYPISKITRAKMYRKCGSSGRAPTLQAWSPEFKLQSHLKKKKALNIRSGYHVYSEYCVRSGLLSLLNSHLGQEQTFWKCLTGLGSILLKTAYSTKDSISSENWDNP
jgi:hypothetical protein